MVGSLDRLATGQTRRDPSATRRMHALPEGEHPPGAPFRTDRPPTPRPNPRRIPVAALLALALGAASPASAGDASGNDFVTSTGHIVAMPPAEALDCDGLRRKLVEIDSTGYRGHRPRPADRADRPLFRYEVSVGTAYYSRCGGAQFVGPRDPARAEKAFRNGFLPLKAN